VCWWRSQSGFAAQDARIARLAVCFGGARAAPEPMRAARRACGGRMFVWPMSAWGMNAVTGRTQTTRANPSRGGGAKPRGSPSASKPGYRRRWDGCESSPGPRRSLELRRAWRRWGSEHRARSLRVALGPKRVEGGPPVRVWRGRRRLESAEGCPLGAAVGARCCGASVRRGVLSSSRR